MREHYSDLTYSELVLKRDQLLAHPDPSWRVRDEIAELDMELYQRDMEIIAKEEAA